MGSGSSRSSRIPRRRRSPDRRQTGPGETGSEGGAADQAPTAAAQEESSRDPRPATPPGGREETLRLLDELLAESEAWGPQERTPRSPAQLPPAVSVGAGPSTHPSAPLVSFHPSFCLYLAPLSPAHPECLPKSLIGFLCPFLTPTPAYSHSASWVGTQYCLCFGVTYRDNLKRASTNNSWQKHLELSSGSGLAFLYQ